MSGTTSPTNVYVYDAPSLLAPPTPPPLTGDIVIRYGNKGQDLGWSLLELRSMRPNLFHAQDWYDQYPWAAEKLPSGLYVLRLPIPDSNRKTYAEQQKLLLPGEEPAHVVLVATALLSLRLSAQPDPLQNGWTRCKEQTADGYRVTLRWNDGRLYVYSHWDVYRYDGVWLASARRTS